jgi:WD40 repeat protein
MINRLYLSASGKYLSTSHGGSGNVRIWDVTNGTELAAVEAQSGWCNAALFLLDDSKILSTGYGGDIRIWDWKDHEMTSIFAIPGAGNAYELQLSRSQDRIGVIASFPEKHQGPGFVREAKAYVWTFPDFRPILEISLGKQSGQMNLSPDGSKIAIALMASSRVILKILDDQSEPVVLMENPLRQIERTSFSSDGRYLAIGCGTTVRIFDVSLGSSTFGQCLKTFDTRMDCHGMQINSARGLEHEVAWRAGGKEHKGTLLEFFADRGAILDEEQQKLLMELRKQRETRQEPPQDRKSADKPRRKHRRK